MKHLLTFIMIAFCSISLAQKNELLYYTVQISSEGGGVQNNDITYYITLKTNNKISNNKQQIEMSVNGLEYDSPSQVNGQFSTSDLNKTKNFLNTTFHIQQLYLLKNPIHFFVEKGTVELDSTALSHAIKQQLDEWAINQDNQEMIIDGTYTQIKQLAQKFYFQETNSLISKSKNHRTVTLNNKKHEILTENKSSIKILTSETDSSSTSKEQALVNLKDSRIKEYSSEVSFKFVIDHRNVDAQVKNHVQQVDLPHEKKISNDYIDMIVQGSYWSHALSDGDNTDSVKFAQYVQKYEPEYGTYKTFILTKLDKIQNLKDIDYDVYEQVLKSVPDQFIKDSHHLTNKLYNTVLSEESFQEVISILDDGQVYRYLQNILIYLVNNNEESIRSSLRSISHDSNTREKSYSLPIYIWTLSLQTNSIDSLKSMHEQLIALDNAYWNNGNAARYALLVNKSISANGRGIRDNIHQIINRLIPLYEDESNEKRFVQKAHLAYAHYLIYEEMSKTDSSSALAFLEKAALYSQKNNNSQYEGSYHDYHFLKAKENYNEDYLKVLSATGNKDIVLKKYLTEFAHNPSTSFISLQKFYEDNFDNQNFGHFFRNDAVKHLSDAPKFDLFTLEDSTFSSHQLLGKWTIVDFWGTWCGPCVEEMPKLNEYYLKLQQNPESNIQFITIACYDTKEKVQTFLEKNGYQIPVLMSDNKVEKDYKVSGYPSKYIITPEGKLIPTEFGFNWEKLVSNLSKI